MFREKFQIFFGSRSRAKGTVRSCQDNSESISFLQGEKEGGGAGQGESRRHSHPELLPAIQTGALNLKVAIYYYHKLLGTKQTTNFPNHKTS
jgi:hypothetical protein